MSFPRLHTARLPAFFLAFCVAQSVFSQNGLSWSAPLPVAASSFGNLSPRMALLADGTPVAVWGKTGATPQIWCAAWADTSFATPVQVSTGSLVPGIYEFGGLDMAVSGQQVFVVFENFDQGIFLVRSDDGGTNWQPPVTVFATPPGMGNTISAITTDASGNPLVSFLLQTSAETDARVHLARSTDGGTTFSIFSNASAPAGDNGQVCECCYQDLLTAGADTVFVAFRANRDNLRDMWVTRSTDGGITFDTACDADAQDWVISACPFSGPSLTRLAGDSLMAVWMSKGSGATRVYASTLHGGTLQKGSEFGFPGSSGAAAFNQNHPEVAGRLDTVAVVWEETGFVGTSQDLVCAFSTTGAAGLAANIAPLPALAAQKFPQLDYSGGIFHLLYVNGTQCLAYRQGTVMAPNGTGEIDKTAQRIRVQPNPAGDFLYLQTTADVGAVELISVDGKTIWSGRAEQGKISVAGLAPGLYVLKIYDVRGVLLDVQKIVKSRSK